jgi:hypothetical protein
MKNFNCNSFFKVCSGLALIIFACAAFCFSVRPAQATPSNMPAFSKNYPVVGNGKYQFMYNIGMDANNDFYWQIGVANTETGGYKYYRWDRDQQKWAKMFGDCMQLPELP